MERLVAWQEPHSKKEENNKFCYKSVCHRITKMTNTGAEIQIDGKTLKINSHLIFSQISRDSIEVLWQTRLPGSFSPIHRFINYQEAVKISRNFDEILMQIKLFFDNEELVFGLNIKRDFVKNKLMIAKEKTSVKYPDINFIYLNTGISFS